MKKKRLILTAVLLVCVAAIVVPNWREIWDAITITSSEYVESDGSKRVGRVRRWDSGEAGLFIGKYRIYYSNGVLARERENDREGQSCGVWRSWSREGELLNEVGYEGDQLHGAARVWTPEGVLVREEESRGGVGRHWDEEGTLVEAMRYKDGIEYCGISFIQGERSGIGDAMFPDRCQMLYVRGKYSGCRTSPPWYDEGTIEAASSAEGLNLSSLDRPLFRKLCKHCLSRDHLGCKGGDCFCPDPKHESCAFCRIRSHPDCSQPCTCPDPSHEWNQ